ncbi:TonB-dependent receptor plug domain-containing protein [Pedobacter sp. LMG 31464]|uniref:TonB-dependent receptor plug domain-containing protein n=1 Tax=Pedobacter planticolens TaxID=2679964 RepID=A0A923DXU3_9SPHI|nr:carboxypeptidase-like regulatory domain-containing protein [Pedobacter planticolens]MBB2145046.1 TonB-dependent receptor plug domain-containing protein [Pedobacter planticolens]
MLKAYLLILALLLGFTLVNAQPLVRVTGVVKDLNLDPLQQVTVAVLGQQESTLTAPDGSYTIYSKTTSFTIKYNLLGYKPVLIKINEKVAGRIVKDLTLIPNINELEQVTVTNKQNQLSNTSTINISDLSSLPSVSGNFESILKTLPGVSTNNELSSQYSVRGGNFDENLVYINDVEISRPILIRNGQQEGLSFINGDLVSRAKFSAGGFEARYGDKLSSVLDVKYDKPDSNQLVLTTGFLGTSLSSKYVADKSFLLMGLRYKNNSSVLNKQDNKGSYSPNFGDAQLLYQYNFSDKFSLSALGNYNIGQFKLIPEDRETQFGTLDTQLRLNIAYNGQEIDSYRTVGGAVTAIFNPQPNLVIKWINSYFNTKERERFDIEGKYIFDELETGFTSAGFSSVRINRGIGTYLNYARNSLNSQTLSSEIKTDQNFDNHVFSWGLRLELNKFRDELNEYHLTDSAGYILPYDAKKFYLDQSIKITNKVDINNFTAFVQDSYSLTENTDLQVGVRGSYNSLSNQFLISPRLLLAYRPPSNNQIIRFTAGIYQQAPTYRSVRAYDGVLNVNQKAQRSYNTSAGFDYAFDGLGTRLKFSSEAYFKYSDRLIPYIIDNVRVKYLSSEIAKGHTYGADFSIGGEFVKDLVSYFRLSFMKADQDIIGDSYVKKDKSGSSTTIYPGYLKRPTDQRINFSVFFQDRLLKSPTYKVHLNMLYGSRLPVGSPQSDHYTDDFRIPAYKRVDIGFSKDFLDDVALRKPKLLDKYFSSFTAYFEVFNLLNINNTVSYLWLKDVDNVQYAVPNYLTGRQFNFKLILKFKNHQ